MKKKLFYALISVTSLFSMSSCSKDSTNPEYPLDGTTWVSNTEGKEKQVGTLKFNETTFSLYYTWVENGEQKTNGGTGTYVYVHPNITLKVGEVTEKLLLTDNIITSSSSTSTEVFKKQ